MDKIARLRQEIERRIKLCNAAPICSVRAEVNKQLLSFLDTLTEENALPCWKKVHTYTEELREGDMEKMLLDLSIGKGKRKTKIALPDRVVNALSEEPDKSLEEAAEEYIKKGKYLPEAFVVRPAFIAGAEWQKQQFEKNYKEIFNDYWTRGFEEGRADMKEEMLKEAMEADVNTYKDPVLSCGWAEFVVDMPSSETDKFGNKVRIVVIKEEE